MFQTFIDTANAPIFGVDTFGRVNEWNTKAAEITGFSRDEVLGNLLVNVHGFSSIKWVLDKALNGEGTANYEFPLYVKDRRRRDLLLNATTWRDVDGITIIGVIGVAQDITERKQIEVEKARVAQELQTFIDTANAPIFGIDADGLVNEWNNKSAAITGFSRQEVLGKNLVQDFITQEYQNSVKEVLDNALQGHETANFEFPLYTKDRRPVEVLLNATTRRDVSGAVIGVIGVGQDITERKQVEVEKSRVAHELQTFIDTANAPIFGIDANGLVNEWNNKSAAITGFSRREVLGKNLVQDFITEEYQQSVKEVLDNALQGRETANFEFPLYTKDQRRVEVLLNATTRRDVTGHVVGVLGVGQDITERKQVEMEKTRVAQELQTFIDTANAPIFGIDANGLVNEWNNKSAEITGFSKLEVLGKDLVEAYITAEFRASVKQVLDKALCGLETANFEFPLFTKNQRRVEVLLNATTRRDVTGNIVGVIGVGQDITERKHAEEEKARVALELQTFIDTANAPIFGIDAHGLVNEWNNKAAAITDFSREEVLGKDLVEVYISADFRASVKQVLDNALQGRETANFEFPLYTKSKHRVEVLLNATTRRDASGRVVGVLGVGQDITQRKQVEEEKTRVAKELQTFIDTANAPIFGIDACGLVNEWNNKSVEITGFSKLEVIGKDLVEVYITAEFRESVRKVLDDALKGKETANFEFPLFTKDQRRVEVLLNATTRRDVTGVIVGVIGVGQDITEMRRLMEQEALLVQVQAANEAKSQFLATMSHEMRTPLNVIMGMNQLVMDTQLSDEQRKFTQQIKTSSDSLLVLINDILDLTKIEAGKLELVSVEFNLRTILEDAVDSVASRAMAKGLEICCYLDANAPTSVVGDPDRLRQILLNLFSNAIKFTDSGQVYVVAEAEDSTATHQSFRFKVHDTGIGISAEGQKKLFNRFSQVDSRTTRTYGGTGLGLAISKQFAELMDGSMGVQSEPGKGSLFWFTAVFRRAVPALEMCTQPYFPRLSQPPRTLLVAKNETLRSKLLRYLEAFGVQPMCVGTIEEAEPLQASGPSIDLVLMTIEFTLGDEDIGAGESDRAFDQSLWNPQEVLTERLHSSMRTLGALLRRGRGLRGNFSFGWGTSRSRCMRAIVLCPATLLSHCATHKEAHGFTLLSRPVRLASLYAAICSVSNSPVNAPASLVLQPGPTATSSVSNVKHSKIPPRLKKDAASEGVHDGHGLDAASTLAMASNDGGARINSEFGWEGQQRPRILVVDDDAGQRMVMKTMLVKDGYEVDVAEDGLQAIKATERVVYDVVLMDGFMPIKTGWDATREIRQREATYRAAAKTKLSAATVPSLKQGGSLASLLSGHLDDDVPCNNVGCRRTNRKPSTEDNSNGRETKGSNMISKLRSASYGTSNDVDINGGLIIIGVTGATTVDDTQKCIESGMTDVIAKPIDRGAISAKVRSWINAHYSPQISSGSICENLRTPMTCTESPDAEPPSFGMHRNHSECTVPISASDMLESHSVKRHAISSSDGVLEAEHEDRNVLVVTDKGQRTVFKALLRQFGGLRADLVPDAAAAEALLSTAEGDRGLGRSYRLAILDTELLGPVSACEVANKLRRSHLTGSVATACGEDSDIAARYERNGLNVIGLTSGITAAVDGTGYTALIRKPIQRQALFSALHACLADDDALISGCVDDVGLCLAPGKQVASSLKQRSPFDSVINSIRILIVEDHWANRRLLESMLLNKGFRVECVENGNDAVNITTENKYDLILMDCNMPIMDGWQATERIRQRVGLNQRTPIVAVTANAMKGDKEKCLEAGMDDYLSKPVDRRLLFETISKWTNTSCVRQGNAQLLATTATFLSS